MASTPSIVQFTCTARAGLRNSTVKPGSSQTLFIERSDSWRRLKALWEILPEWSPPATGKSKSTSAKEITLRCTRLKFAAFSHKSPRECPRPCPPQMSPHRIRLLHLTPRHQPPPSQLLIHHHHLPRTSQVSVPRQTSQLQLHPTPHRHHLPPTRQL